MTAAQRLSALKVLNEQHISANLLRTFAADTLTAACKHMDLSQVFADFTDQEASLQSAVLAHEAFLPVLQALLDADLSPSRIQSLMISAASEDVSFMDLTAQQILAVNGIEMESDVQRWQVFRYYGEYLFDAEQFDDIQRSLRQFYSVRLYTLSSLTDTQREVLRLPFWSHYVLGYRRNLEAALEVVPGNLPLQQMMTHLYDHGMRLALDPEEWSKLRHVTDEDAELVSQLLPFVEEPGWGAVSFFDHWVANGCHTYDLKRLNMLLPRMEKEKQKEMFATRLTYLSGLYGKQLDGLALDELNNTQSHVLIHAMAEEQNAFLRLVRQHFDTFRDLPNGSMLFHAAFYERICLNSMTERDLNACKYVLPEQIQLKHLAEGRYTFAELKALAYAPEQYAKLYNRLLDQGVDKRLLLIRQLLKHRWLTDKLTDEQLDELAARLKEKPFDRWREEDMAHIERLRPTDAVRLLACFSQVGRFLHDIRTGEEASFAVRNQHKLGDYTLWANARNDMVALDDDWKELCEAYDFPQDFLQANADGLMRFIAQEGAGITHTYWKRQPDSREDLRRIIQAEIMGRLPELKYHRDDLSRELNVVIPDQQKAAWMENTEMASGAFAIKEKDDFYTTMQIGEIPIHTCLSYQNGMQANCLLSWFDANKKILMAYRDGTPVARAMIRLTKGGCFAQDRQGKLAFVDLQHASGRHQSEESVLFLETIYSNGLRDREKREVSRLFIRLMTKKAAQLGAVLVVSNGAMNPDGKTDEVPQGFLHMRYAIFISRSKAGAQYLDSLSGQNTVVNEGQYHSGMFYVQDEQSEVKYA